MANETATRIPSTTAAAEPFSRARLAIAIAAAVVLNGFLVGRGQQRARR